MVVPRMFVDEDEEEESVDEQHEAYEAVDEGSETRSMLDEDEEVAAAALTIMMTLFGEASGCCCGGGGGGGGMEAYDMWLSDEEVKSSGLWLASVWCWLTWLSETSETNWVSSWLSCCSWS